MKHEERSWMVEVEEEEEAHSSVVGADGTGDALEMGSSALKPMGFRGIRLALAGASWAGTGWMDAKCHRIRFPVLPCHHPPPPRRRERLHGHDKGTKRGATQDKTPTAGSVFHHWRAMSGLRRLLLGTV